MLKKWMPYLLFFVVLLTGYFYFVFTQTDIKQSGLAVINTGIQPFRFINQDSVIVTEKDLEGKVVVAEYFFTTCRGICPKMNANMRRVFDAYRGDTSFLIVSHTCMPETDSVPLLKAYQQKMLYGKLMRLDDGTHRVEYDSNSTVPPMPNPNWIFLTGDKAKLYDMARTSYMIDFNKADTAKRTIDEQFIHTQFFALLDKQSRVRAIYDGLIEEEVQKLIKDIEKLKAESYQTRSL